MSATTVPAAANAKHCLTKRAGDKPNWQLALCGNGELTCWSAAISQTGSWRNAECHVERNGGTDGYGHQRTSTDKYGR